MIARFFFLIAGIALTVQGLYGLYFFSVWGSGHGADWRGILTSLSFLGFPMGVFCLSISYLWTVRPTVSHFLGYFEVCGWMVVHVVQVVVALTVVGVALPVG